MADITEAEQWDTGVYQLETTDPVQGGDDGVDNLPHKALANRTLWLKAQVALKALLSGSATQRFKVAAAVADDEATNKAQVNDLLSDIDISNFANSKSQAGYQKLPNGLILQWGTCVTNSGGGFGFTFPIAFSNDGLVAHSNPQSDNYNSQNGNPSATSVGGGTINGGVNGSAGVTVNVFAIGY